VLNQRRSPWSAAWSPGGRGGDEGHAVGAHAGLWLFPIAQLGGTLQLRGMKRVYVCPEPLAGGFLKPLSLQLLLQQPPDFLPFELIKPSPNRESFLAFSPIRLFVHASSSCKSKRIRSTDRAPSPGFGVGYRTSALSAFDSEPAPTRFSFSPCLRNVRSSFHSPAESILN